MTTNTPALNTSGAICDSLCLSNQKHLPVSQAALPNQFRDFFLKIFDTSDWPARWHCGHWTDFHGWLYILSDISIWAAYFAIPLLLFRIVNKRKDLPFLKLFWLFMAFILLCGTTHLLDAAIFWWPAYRLSAVVRFFTAGISIVTVLALYRAIPMVYNLRTLSQLEAEIDERKRAEAEVRHHQVMQHAAEELIARKDEFMSIASHELKTPITSLKASLQLMQRMMNKKEPPATVIPFIDKASKQVDKLTAIIHDLMDVTKIQAGKLDLNITEFDLVVLIEECIEQCQIETIRRFNIQIHSGTAMIVNADRNRIDQVLCNLLTNAMKYSPQSDLIEIDIKKIEGGGVKVSVKDNGIGIPEDKVNNIFDRFYRVENTSKNFSGIGLGLFISSEIIKRHQGEIGVESTFGSGSTFWFSLPS